MESGRLLETFWTTQSSLTWDFTKIKIKTYTWNSSVGLLSPTCLFYFAAAYVHLRKVIQLTDKTSSEWTNQSLEVSVQTNPVEVLVQVVQRR